MLAPGLIAPFCSFPSMIRTHVTDLLAKEVSLTIVNFQLQVLAALQVRLEYNDNKECLKS